MREPINVLIIPFHHHSQLDGVRYAVFKRRDSGVYQFIAGGVETGESPKEAAIRESREEAGIESNSRWIELESTAAIPLEAFACSGTWREEIQFVQEVSYGVEIKKTHLVLSDEHSEYRWLPYQEAHDHLMYDSNKVALRELHGKLTRSLEYDLFVGRSD